MTADEQDAAMARLDAGLDLALARAKVWSRYTRGIITYIEKKSQLGEHIACDTWLRQKKTPFFPNTLYPTRLMSYSKANWHAGVKHALKICHSIKASYS